MKLNFSNLSILVVGDVMLDHYFYGKKTRNSPEAPVPILVKANEKFFLGGAANVANNLNKLGATVSCAGVVGHDLEGKIIVDLLKKENIDTSKILTSNYIKTTVKKRIFEDGKPIVRIDSETIEDHSAKLKFIFDQIDFNNYDGIIFSDYDKGVLFSRSFIKKIIQSYKGTSFVDPKKQDFSFYKGINIITPNLSELQEATKIKNINDDQIVNESKKLINQFGFDYVISKLSDKGMILISKDNHFKCIAHKVESPDVTGAGDTVIASLALSYLLTKDIHQSIKISNFCASLVVAKRETAFVSIDELNSLINF